MARIDYKVIIDTPYIFYTSCICASVHLCICASVHLCICASVHLHLHL